MKERTARLFRLIEEQNKNMHERESKETKAASVGLDPIREKRDAERRARLGKLRARPPQNGRGPFRDS
jgi:hypothetical protein